MSKYIFIYYILYMLHVVSAGGALQPKWDNRPTVVGRTQKQQGKQMMMMLIMMMMLLMMLMMLMMLLMLMVIKIMLKLDFSACI